jgi:hypothetical protein
MKYEKVKDIVYRVFDFYYDIQRESYNDLDYVLHLYDGSNNRALYIRDINGKYYLGYYSKDLKVIKSIIPLTNYMFNKCLKNWVQDKLKIKVDEVLLPR